MARMTIIGTGVVGTSIGLALHQAKASFEIVGHDRDLNKAGDSKKSGALDRVEWNLPAALDDAAVVIVATPFSAIEEVFKQISPYLGAGTIVTDTAVLKTPVLAWAEQHLPREVRFVGGHPIVDVNSLVTKPSVDLFQGVNYCLTPGSSADTASIDQMSRLAEALGAQPLFIDPTEHDSHVASLSQVPAVLSAALLAIVTRNPAWRDGQRLASSAFADVTSQSARGPVEVAAAWRANQEILLTWLDLMRIEIDEFARLIKDDPASLEKILDDLQTQRIVLRPGEEVRNEPMVELPRSRDTLGSMFWGRRGNNQDKDKDKTKK
jgi:prephenate dehydrogenase